MIREIGGYVANMVCVLIFLLACPKRGSPQGRGIINNSKSPYCRLRSVNLGDIRWSGGFWFDRFNLVKEVTVPRMWEYFQRPDVYHWKNLRIAAGLEKGMWSGTSWHDGDFYKWLEAVAHVYHVTRDRELDRLMDSVIEVIGKAQQPDGYISTQIILEKRKPFQNIHHHELYNMGHLMTAACMHFRATGKTDFLEIAKKTGGFLYNTFSERRPELANFGFNPSNIMGAVELYRTTGNPEYLDLAKTFVEMRGSAPAGSRHYGLGGTDQTQDRVPLRQETGAVGHAVTATYLYCGAADVFMETGDRSLLHALERIWSDVTRHKVYIHGGVGPLTRGLSIRNDDVHEAFAGPYFLPNRKAYSETCANIGNAMWNWRMLNITGDARYAEVMEQVFYNSGISGLGLDGDSFFYTNVLRRFGQEVPLLRSDAAQRWKHRRGYCCPPQIARTITRMQGYAYSLSEDALWVHLYGSNVLDTHFADGTPVQVTQETDYPWDGLVKITFGLPCKKPIALKLRIPSWAKDASVKVNGLPVRLTVVPGHYTTVRQTWKKGDVVELSLPMKARLTQANPLVEELRNQVAVVRGPVVYCLESVDLPDGIGIMDVLLPRNISFEARFDRNLLGGVTVLKGEALHRQAAEWSQGAYESDALYREVSDAPPSLFSLRMIPYYAWSNRGISQMTVWLPIDWIEEGFPAFGATRSLSKKHDEKSNDG